MGWRALIFQHNDNTSTLQASYDTHPTTMDRLKWVASEGGPLILISDKSKNLWSGILKRSSYLANKIEEADDFLDADEADYGKACLVQDYLGVVNVGNDTALVLGDEPLLSIPPAKYILQPLANGFNFTGCC